MASLPPLLVPGDTIALISPSRLILEDQLTAARNVFDQWNLRVLESPLLFATDGYLAGTDDQRVEEWHWALNNPSVKAIFCARGGYGLTRIIDQIDFDSLLNSPKWIIGFSDITAAHLRLDKLGYSGVHALMPVQYGYESVDESLESLRSILFDGLMRYTFRGTALQNGEVVAPVIGGNLSLLAESLGTPTEIQTSGKILLIEEIDEYLYKVDRMLNQLKRAGKFTSLAGVIIGDFSDLKDTEIPFGKSMLELIRHYFSGDYPVAWQIPMGHENKNLAIPINVSLHLKVEDSGTTLTLPDQNHRHPES